MAWWGPLSFPHTWAINVLTFLGHLMFSTFYTSVLNVFLVSVDCRHDNGVETLDAFPTRACACWGSPHVFLAATGIFMAIAFFLVALGMLLLDYE